MKMAQVLGCRQTARNGRKLAQSTKADQARNEAANIYHMVQQAIIRNCTEGLIEGFAAQLEDFKQHMAFE